MAGLSLKKTSKSLWVYFGCSIASGVLIAIGQSVAYNGHFDSHEDVGNALSYIGMGVEIIGLVYWINHIIKIEKAGKELEKVRY